MLLFVGLGNPTPDSENNRHNIGFKLIDALNQKFGLSKQKPKFKGLLTTGNIEDKKVYAIKPLTFMNNSGICIRELIEYFKIDAEDVIVFHDDLDLEFGKVKAKFAGSSAGHNGIESIDKFIGKDYSRVRIGIGRPKTKADVSDHVLKDFDEDEMIQLEKITKNINIPTIGIGASNNCDGQVLVTDDLIGLNPINVRFVKKYSNIRNEIVKAVRNYSKDVKNKKFPLKKHSY